MIVRLSRWLWILVALSVPLRIDAGERTLFVLTGEYKSFWDEDEPTGERASMIAEALKSAAEDAGWTARLKGACAAADCLEKAVEQGADQAVTADVEAHDALYNITVRVAGKEAHKLVLEGAFKEVVAELEKAARPLLEADIPDPEAAARKSAAHIGASAAEQEAPAAGSPDGDEERSLLDPALFWTGVGLSLSLTGTWIALDVATHKRYLKMKDRYRGAEYLETSTNLQLASRVLLGVSLAAIACTAVIAVFTDFKRNSSNKKVSLSASPANDGGALLLSGSF